MRPFEPTTMPEGQEPRRGAESILDAVRSPTLPVNAARVLRNTYALLSMTLLFSAAVAAAGVALKLPAPGIIITLLGYFALL